jgi:hypothetical protein
MSLFVVWIWTTVAIYDAIYGEILDGICRIGIWVHLVAMCVDIYTGHRLLDDMYSSFLGAGIVYTFLFLQICIPASIYAVREKIYTYILYLLFAYILFPFAFLV